MPQPFNSAVMTDAGAELLTKAQAGQCKIEFTHIAIGNGTYTEEEKAPGILQKQKVLKAQRNEYALSSVSINNIYSVKVTALITNQNTETHEALITSGYFINEIGLFAREKDREGEEEILYSIAVTSGETGDFMPPYNGFNPVQILQDYYATVNNSAEITIQTDNGAVALAKDVTELQNRIEIAEEDIDNLKKTEKESIEELQKRIIEIEEKILSNAIGKVLIGPAGTAINQGDTLFIVDGEILQTQAFEGAAFENLVFSRDAPGDAQYWAPEDGGTASAQAGGVSVISGNIAVSEEEPEDAAFFAKINN